MPCAGPTGMAMLGCCGGINTTVHLTANVYCIGFRGNGIGCIFSRPGTPRGGVGTEFSAGYSWSITYSPGGTATGSITLPPVVRRRSDAPTITLVDNTDPAEVAAFLALPADSTITTLNTTDCQTQTKRTAGQTKPGILPFRSVDFTSVMSTDLLPIDKTAVKQTLLAQKFGGPPFVYRNVHIMDRTGALDNGFPASNGLAHPWAGGFDPSRSSIWSSDPSIAPYSALPAADGRSTMPWDLFFTSFNGDYAAYQAALVKLRPPQHAIEVGIFWRTLSLALYKNTAKESLCRTMSSPLGNIVFCQKGITDDSVFVDVRCSEPYYIQEDGFVYVPADANKPACCA